MLYSFDPNISQRKLKFINKKNISEEVNKKIVQKSLGFEKDKKEINNQKIFSETQKLIYKVDNRKDNEKKENFQLRIFGEKFVEINKKNFMVILNNKKSFLKSKIKMKKVKDIVIIKLIQIMKKITNFDSMFKGCSSFSSLPDISKLDISNATNISNFFCGCSF